MSLLNDLLSSIDPSATPKGPTPATTKPVAAAGSKPVSRSQTTTNGTAGSQLLKRKAEGPLDNSQPKAQRKDGIGAPRPNGPTRPMTTADPTKPKPPSASTIPYRGTAASSGSNGAKPVATVTKKPVPQSNATSISKPAATVNKSSTTSTPTPPATGRPVKMSYAAMLQAAKEKEQSKAPAPPVRHEAPKILTKKEREALRAAAKGKKPAAGLLTNKVKSASPKLKGEEKAKPVGYQGTARPKKPVEIGYKGTAKPQSTATAGAAGRPSSNAAMKAKPKPLAKRYDGYANWSDLDDMDDEDEPSEDDLSDMEGGIWDVEQEEEFALKEARRDDAKELAEENARRREKQRRLAELSKAAAARKKY